MLLGLLPYLIHICNSIRLPTALGIKSKLLLQPARPCTICPLPTAPGCPESLPLHFSHSSRSSHSERPVTSFQDALARIKPLLNTLRTSLVAQTVKCLSTMRETRVQSLVWEDPLEKEMAIHSSTIAWKIPWTEEPGREESIGLQRVRHD